MPVRRSGKRMRQGPSGRMEDAGPTPVASASKHFSVRVDVLRARPRKRSMVLGSAVARPPRPYCFSLLPCCRYYSGEELQPQLVPLRGRGQLPHAGGKTRSECTGILELLENMHSPRVWQMAPELGVGPLQL
jgi:hypothetical protein